MTILQTGLTVVTKVVACVKTDVTILIVAEVVVLVEEEMEEAGIEVMGKESPKESEYSRLRGRIFKEFFFVKIHIHFINTSFGTCIKRNRKAISRCKIFPLCSSQGSVNRK